MVTFPNIEQSRLIKIAEQFEFSDYDQSYGVLWKRADLEKAVIYGRNIESRINVVGGGITTLEELVKAETPDTVPESATIGFDNVTVNSVLVFWNPHSDGGSPITGFHLVVKNQDTGQTIIESNTSFNVTNTLVQNLDSGTNYKAYIIVKNSIGNSFEQSKAFKTLGTKPITQLFQL